MIYFQSKDEKHVIVLSPEEIGFLMNATAVISPDQFVFIAYSPDITWTALQLKEVFDGPDPELSMEKLAAILAEGLKRPQVKQAIDLAPEKPIENSQGPAEPAK